MPYWKGCLIALVVLIVLVVWIVFGMQVLQLNNPWVGIIVLCAWTILYRSNIADIPKVWIGSATALVLGYLFWYLPTILGAVAGGITASVLCILLLGAFIAQKPHFISNYIYNGATAFMMTIVTCSSQINNTHLHLQFLKDLVYGAVCFGLIPWGIAALAALKGKKAAVSGK